MVDTMQLEIDRLESKLAAAEKPPAKKTMMSPTVGKKSKSPTATATATATAKIRLDTYCQGQSNDPELMREISSAVANRLKEIWALED